MVVNPSYVPAPNTAANNTDSNTHNNYQVVTGNDNIVVGKAVNTTVSQVGPSTMHVWTMELRRLPALHVGTGEPYPCWCIPASAPFLMFLLFSERFCAPRAIAERPVMRARS